ncbi:NEAT domain-containing protein [Paenibacillus daejeonensis]|uniref:NEAT domain-containing protein n=1 Tax=Paenibacillus daejeonensis TaxID=135193 RepID=UPI000361C3D1|nr:NEAT domain-containing protein [Paenibacillus daejeonensis]
MSTRKSFRWIALLSAWFILLSSVHISTAAAAPDPSELEDGLYSVSFNSYKHNTNEISVMNTYIGTSAVLEVKDGEQTVHALLRFSNWIKELKIGTTIESQTDVVNLTEDLWVFDFVNTQGDTYPRTSRIVSFPVEQLGNFNYEGFTHIEVPQGQLPFTYNHKYDLHFQVGEPAGLVANSTGTLADLQQAIGGAEQVLDAGKRHADFVASRAIDLTDSITYAKAIAALPSATPLQITAAQHYLEQDAAVFADLYPGEQTADITVQAVHATDDYRSSAMSGYLASPKAVTSAAGTAVQLLINDHKTVTSFMVEQNGELVEATNVSVNADANTRLIEFPVSSLDAVINARVHVSTTLDNGQPYEMDHNIRLIFNRALNRVELQSEVTAAQQLHNQAVVGTEVGQYPQEATTALQAAINQAKVDGSMLSTQEKVNAALANLRTAVEAFKSAVVAAPGNGQGTPISIQVVHGTDDYRSSSMASYLLNPRAVTENGETSVQLTVKDHTIVTSFKVQQAGELKEAATVSVDTETNTRLVTFPVSSLDAVVQARVHISTSMPNGSPYEVDHDIRLIFNRALDRADLQAEVTSAQKLHDEAVVGTAAGQYPAAAKTALLTAINKAKVDGSMLSTQAKVNTALTELKAAVNTFKGAVVAPGNGGGPVTPPPGGLADGKYSINLRVLKNGTSETSIMNGYVYHPARLLVQNGVKTIVMNLGVSDKITSFSVSGSSISVVETNANENSRRVSFNVSDLTQKLDGEVRIDWSEINYHYTYKIQLEFGNPIEVDEWPVENPPNPNPPTETPNPNPPATGGNGTGGGGTTPGEEGEQGTEPGTDNGSENPSQPGSNGNGGGTETPTPPAVTFTDTATHWANQSIARATELGIVNGYADGTFKPNATVNRAEFAAIISRAFQLDLNAPASSFSDWNGVQAWAKPFIEQAVAAGIINGYEDGSFRPTQQVSRTEIAVMIVRALGLHTNSEAELSFQDAGQIPAYAKPYIAAAVEHGLIEGLGNNTFGAQAPATRAQAITLILRALDYLAASQNGQAA